MIDSSPQRLFSAAHDFRRARRRAALEDILAQLTGKSDDLLSYEDALHKLKARGTSVRGVQEIPLDAIVGSVGRYSDFTRSFLPRRDSGEERWARLKAQVANHGILHPIKVYQIGEAYFVLDGNHRVSVARELGASHIVAHVIEVHTKVPLSREDRPDDLILKAEYADFLERTQLDAVRPEASLRVTVPGQYRAIEEQIEGHRRLVSEEQEKEMPYREAVGLWYDEVYLPVVRGIRQGGILRDFPGRTETDLYVWISLHRAELEEQLGWEIRPEAAAASLVEQASPKPQRVVSRVSDRIIEAITPEELQAGARPGHWRKEHLAMRRDDRLFADILVALNGQDTGWRALDQALEVARREGARLHGLHIVTEKAPGRSEQVQSVRDEFRRRCEQAGIAGKLAVEAGQVAHIVVERAQWTDLVVVSLSHPPGPQPMARLGSGLSTLLRRVSRPVLTVPQVTPMKRVLLAYDGRRKADEALFVATYLAGRWNMTLAVVTVIERGRASAQTLERARRYLTEHEVEADFFKESGSVAKVLLGTVTDQRIDLLIMGGYGLSPVLEVVLGSTVDQLLRESRLPILICR